LVGEENLTFSEKREEKKLTPGCQLNVNRRFSPLTSFGKRKFHAPPKLTFSPPSLSHSSPPLLSAIYKAEAESIKEPLLYPILSIVR
jgi:hypothetical protein